MTEVEGVIFDEQHNPLNGVRIQLILNATGAGIGPATVLNGAAYTAWTPDDPESVSVSFQKTGFKSQKRILMDLYLHGADITMEKGESIPITAFILVVAAVALHRKRSKKVGKLTKQDLIPIGLILAGVLAFDLIKKILEMIGIWDSRESKGLDQAATDPNSFWNPNYWMNIPAGTNYTNPITESQAGRYADIIYESFGAFNDNEEETIGVFKRLPSQAAASFLAWKFGNMYGQDLLTFLRGGVWPQDRLSDSDVYTINSFVQRLPKY